MSAATPANSSPAMPSVAGKLAPPDSSARPPAIASASTVIAMDSSALGVAPVTISLTT